MLRKVFVADSDAVISLWSLRPQAGVLPVGADAESIGGGQMRHLQRRLDLTAATGGFASGSTSGY